MRVTLSLGKNRHSVYGRATPSLEAPCNAAHAVKTRKGKSSVTRLGEDVSGTEEEMGRY